MPNSLSRRSTKRGLLPLSFWFEAVVVMVITLGVEIVVFLAWVQPAVRAKADISTELAFFQLAIGGLTLVAAALFGVYAVKQVEQGRRALESDNLARRHADETEARRVLTALLAELNHDRGVALFLEGRMHLPAELSVRWTPRFQQDVYRALRAGSLWGIPEIERVYEAVALAYWEMDLLSIELEPHPSWLPMVLGAVILAGFYKTKPSEADPLKKYIFSAASGLVGYALLYVQRQLHVNCRGLVTRTRKGIENAMECVYEALYGRQLPWVGWDQALPKELHVVPDNRRQSQRQRPANRGEV